jgi:MFS family permease
MVETTAELTETEGVDIKDENGETRPELSGFWAINKDRAFRYRTIIGLGVIALLAELAYMTLNQSALQPYVEKELHLQPGWLSWIYISFLLVEALCRPGLGGLGDRIGRRPLLVAGPIASCLAAILIANVRNPSSIVALRVLDGLGAAAIWPTAFALVGDTVEERNRSTAMSVLNVTYMLGIALGPLLGGVIADNSAGHSQKYVFYAVAGLFILTMLVALAVIPKHEKPHHDASHDNSVGYHLSYLLVSLRAIPHMLAMVFFAFGAIGFIMPISKLFATDVLGLTETGYGIMLLPVAAVLAVSSIPLGRVGDKWGKVESVRLGMTLTCIAMWLLTLVGTKVMLFVAGSLLGVGFLMAMPAWMALITSLAGSDNRGKVLGGVGMAQGLGVILGVKMGDMMYHGVVRLPSINPHIAPLFMSATLLTLSAAMAFIFLKRKEPQGQIV